MKASSPRCTRASPSTCTPTGSTCGLRTRRSSGRRSQQPWGSRVRLRPARHAAAELGPTFQQILRDQDYWRQRGLPVVQSGVRHDGSCIEVGTPDPRRAEREFSQRYPGAPMCFSVQADTGNPWQERR
ncbi:hypothetical protein [Micromonospora pallida]|uniref:hypothetical protein n=1 Tax=Micromonospora pallida TaxID=145854 RepID=UPI00114D0F12|nr:hypothetical protein [Micromonospora pallida]